MKLRIDGGNFSRGEPTSKPIATQSKMTAPLHVLIDTDAFETPSEAAAALRRVVDTVLKTGEWGRVQAITPRQAAAEDA